MSEVVGLFEELDGWIRRKLRAVRWRQWKRPRTRFRQLQALGLDEERAAKSAFNGRGPWWNARSPHMHQVFPAAFFARMGLVSLQQEHRRLSHST